MAYNQHKPRKRAKKKNKENQGETRAAASDFYKK
jgi:hypothetical protein